MKLRRWSLNRSTPTSPTNGTSGPDTPREGRSPGSLPIAEQFMRSPTMPQSPTDVNSSYGYDYDSSEQRRSVSSEMSRAAFPQRKPVPKEVDRPSSDMAPPTSTVRIVPNHLADSNSSEPGQDRHGNNDIVPNFSRLNMGQSPYSEANVAAGLPPRAGVQEVIPRSSLDKPLPIAPTRETDHDNNGEPPASHDEREHGPASTHDLEKMLGVEGQIDLRHTEDAETQTRWKPVITHETITQNIHEIEEQQITREIHEHHVFHRILPIVEVEVLPARHYVPDRHGALQEVKDQRASRRVDKYIQKGVSKALEKAHPKSSATARPRTFTAREFPGEVGDYKEYLTPGGPVRSDSWWVHPPTLETGGMESGQTQPFHLGSSEPEDDGWRS